MPRVVFVDADNRISGHRGRPGRAAARAGARRHPGGTRMPHQPRPAGEPARRRLVAPAPGWTRRRPTSSSSARESPGWQPRFTARTPGCRSWSSPRRCWTPAPRAGRRAGSPPRSARATPRAAPARHARRPASGMCDEAAVAAAGHRGPGAGTRARGARRRVRPGRRRADFALTREGGHHRNRIVHAGGDATGAGGASARSRRRACRSRHRGDRARAGTRSATGARG